MELDSRSFILRGYMLFKFLSHNLFNLGDIDETIRYWVVSASYESTHIPLYTLVIAVSLAVARA